ncbi:MAG TPA: DEAD/DEAH box helicase family protein [Acidimicrobiales bacterium]|nr:DEAD/DEAH box helicase family protein [Acidimicrobiales bacterium]
MARSIRLRPWQKAALERLATSPDADFLAVATPGAGKTTFALTAAHHALATSQAERVIVVTPTAHLRSQWSQAAARFDLALDPGWSPRNGLTGDLHGLVTTYQQVAASAAPIAALARRSFVILDEVHHAADERAWGDALVDAFADAPRRLSLSGTPFRSDTRGIPFVRYVQDEAAADYEYGYGEALRDGGVVRPVYFPRIDGHMEWTAPDGSLHEATFADALDRDRAAQRLRTALSADGEWLPTVLLRAHEQLREIREVQPEAGGLVIAVDQDHARDIARILRERVRTDAVVVTSDDPTASARIDEFALGSTPWIVAVRMVSEGVDIPRLRVGVFATTTTTELFFRQAVGRLVRWTAALGPQQPAFLFIPDDARLRARAHQLTDLRRHSLRRAERDRAEREAMRSGNEEQLSLFAAISAIALGDGVEHEQPAWLLDTAPAGELDDDGLTLDLPPLPGAPALPGAAPTFSRVAKRRELRDANAVSTRMLVQRTGLGHAQVNNELNRLAGVGRIADATLEQLERRLRHAERWLTRTTPRGAGTRA